MWLLGQVGLAVDPFGLALFFFASVYAGIAVALWVVVVMTSGRGLRLPTARQLPRFVSMLLAAVAAILWAVCAWGYSNVGPRSEVAQAVFSYAVAFTVAALCAARRSRAGSKGG